ncbi:MAG: glycoside hydrolase family 70 protein [Streptococcus sp.]
MLANDIDNSNPAVQAEQLNWLHFMMNIGSIMAKTQQLTLTLRVDALTMWMLISPNRFRLLQSSLWC